MKWSANVRLHGHIEYCLYIWVGPILALVFQQSAHQRGGAHSYIYGLVYDLRSTVTSVSLCGFRSFFKMLLEFVKLPIY